MTHQAHIFIEHSNQLYKAFFIWWTSNGDRHTLKRKEELIGARADLHRIIEIAKQYESGRYPYYLGRRCRNGSLSY